MQTLRLQTRAAHERIECAVDVERRLKSRAGYEALLTYFHGFFAPFEDVLAGACDWRTLGVDYEARRKAGSLQGDLLALGLSDARIEALPRCSRLPRPDGPAQALGCLYVLEGSTLGGQIVGRLLREALPEESRIAGRFFEGYGPENGRMWRAFGAAVESFAGRYGGQAAMAAAANETFTCLSDWFLEVPYVEE